MPIINNNIETIQQWLSSNGYLENLFKEYDKESSFNSLLLKVNNKVDKDGDKVLSDNNFTDKYKSKLDNLVGFDGYFRLDEIDLEEITDSGIYKINDGYANDFSILFVLNDINLNNTIMQLWITQYNFHQRIYEGGVWSEWQTIYALKSELDELKEQIKNIDMEITDENGNAVLGDADSHHITENSKNNVVEGQDNSVGVARIPAILGTIPSKNENGNRVITDKMYSKLQITNVRLGDYMYFNDNKQLVQCKIIEIKDFYGAINENANLNRIVEFTLADEVFIVSSTNTKESCFTFSNPLIISDYDVLMEIDQNIEVNNSHVEGTNNSIISDNGHVEGEANLVGAKCFRIHSSNINNKCYLIKDPASISGLEVGDIYSLKIGANYNDHGRITNIEAIETDECATIYVDNFVEVNVPDDIDETSTDFTFRIASKPWLGIIDWAPNSRASGVGNKVLADEGSADGRENIIKGRYGRASGRGNEVGYGAHAQNLNNKALGERSSAAGSGTVASGANSFTNGEFTVAASKNQSVRGQYNKIDNKGKYVDIVGNGKTEGTRANAYALDWAGNAEYSGDIIAKDYTVTNGIKIKGYSELSSDLQEVQYPSSINDISINRVSKIKNPIIINPLCSIDEIYHDTLSISSDKSIQTQNIRHFKIPANETGIDWRFSTMASTDDYKLFYIGLQLSSINGENILTEYELNNLDKFLDISNKIAKGYWKNGEKYKELTFTGTIRDVSKDCSFYIDRTSEYCRIWFVSRVGDGYSNITTLEQMKETPIELFFILTTPNTIDVTNNFRGVWDSIKDDSIGTSINIQDNNSILLDYNIECESIIGSGGSGSDIIVDNKLSITSTNPVQNKVITNELNAKADANYVDEMAAAIEDTYRLAENKIDKEEGKRLINDNINMIISNVFGDIDDEFDDVIKLSEDFDPRTYEGTLLGGYEGISKILDKNNNFIGIYEGFYISDESGYYSITEVFEDLNGVVWTFGDEDGSGVGSKWQKNPRFKINLKDKLIVSKIYVDNAIGDIETSLENIIQKYGLGNSQS